MGSSKMNEIQDPLASQKTAAANLGLQNYQTASGAVPSLMGYYGNNFGQNQQQTLAGQSPLFQDVYSQMMAGEGGGGPFASLKQNLLGSFDAGNAQNNQNLNQQLQAQGLMGSGAGMAVLGDQGVNAAQQRALLGSQADVNQMTMADQIAQQLQQLNQQQGFTNPMAALSQVQSLAQPPQFQSVDNTYYTPQNKFQTTADILGAISPMIGSAIGSVGSAMGGGQPSGNGAPAMGAPGIPPTNYYSGVNSMMNNPQLLQMLMASGGG